MIELTKPEEWFREGDPDAIEAWVDHDASFEAWVNPGGPEGYYGRVFRLSHCVEIVRSAQIEALDEARALVYYRALAFTDKTRRVAGLLVHEDLKKQVEELTAELAGYPKPNK